MNAVDTRSHPDATPQPFSWSAQIKLAVVLSVVAALTATALAGRVADSIVIVGVIVVASALAWNRVEPMPETLRVHVRHR